MAITAYGVTADTVRKHFFPTLTPFGANSSPSLTIAGEKVTWAAARLDGQLRMKGVSPEAITDPASAAYYWCAETLSLMTALDLLPAMSGNWSEAAKEWKARLAERLENLATYGAQALGAGAAAASSEGPGTSSHISVRGLYMGDDLLASSVEPRLRRDDEL